MRVTQGTFSQLPDLTDNRSGTSAVRALDTGWPRSLEVHR